MQKILSNSISKFGLIILFFLPQILFAQYFVAGQDPASIKWRQIQSANFQLIFPSDFESQAQRVAQIFERVYSYSGVSLQHHPKKISIILHTKTIKSNGFVAWSPSRIELYPTPDQEMYAQDWIEQLAIHELRHHVQIDKIETELPAIFRILFGEQAAAVIMGAYLPFWFLEGDAVATETALSNSGRGRLPSFSMELKAQVDEKGIFSFDKAYLGSYRDYVPDYYQLGYQMVSNIRISNGGDVWSKVLHHISRNPLGLNSLSKGLKLATGKNQDEHYRVIMNNLKSTNPFGLNALSDSGQVKMKVVKGSKFYTSYRYPYFVNDSSFIALKTTLNDIPSIVLVDKYKNEKALFFPGQILEESMSYSDGKIIWIESKPDIRWTNKERSLLRILDIRNGKLIEYVYDEKLSAPMISPDGIQVAAIKFDDQNICSVVLLTVENGKITKEIKANNHNTLFTPSWATDQKSLFAIELNPKGKSIIQINLASGNKIYLTQPVFGELKKPIQKQNFIFYSCDLKGKNEGYALNLSTKKSYRILTAKYGIKDLSSSEDGNSLIWGDYSSNGFKTTKAHISKANWEDVIQENWYREPLADKLSAQEGGHIDFSNMDTTKIKSEKYLKLKNIINIHSWSPFYIDPDQTAINTGFSVISQNKLTTAITQFGYNYSTTDHAGKWVGKFEYSGWYPILRLSGDYGRENSTYYQITKHYNSKNVLIGQDTAAVSVSQKVMNLHADISIPMNFSKGKMYRMIEPEFQIGYSHKWQETTTPANIFWGSYVPFTYRLYAHNLTQQSAREIQTRWGQVIDMKYRNTPFGDRKLGNITSLEGTIYLPGLFLNQGIKLYGGYQIKNSANSYFGDLIYYPRGYSTMENNKLSSFRSDYVLPLLSPDWNIWHLYYLKRVTLRLHYDFSQIAIPIYHSNSTIIKNLSSTGIQILTECHFLRFIAPIKLGVRESFLIEPKTFTSEFLFSVNLKGI